MNVFLLTVRIHIYVKAKNINGPFSQCYNVKNEQFDIFVVLVQDKLI